MTSAPDPWASTNHDPHTEPATGPESPREQPICAPDALTERSRPRKEDETP